MVSVEHAVLRYSALSHEQKLAFLARYGHELTITARDTYVVQSEDVSDPPRLRAINEIQHRVFDHIMALLNQNERRFDDQTIVRILLNATASMPLRSQTAYAFERAYERVVASKLQ